MAELGIEFSYTWVIEGDQASGGGKAENGKLIQWEDEIECNDNGVPNEEMPELPSYNEADSDNFPSDIPF